MDLLAVKGTQSRPLSSYLLVKHLPRTLYRDMTVAVLKEKTGGGKRKRSQFFYMLSSCTKIDCQESIFYLNQNLQCLCMPVNCRSNLWTAFRGSKRCGSERQTWQLQGYFCLLWRGQNGIWKYLENISDTDVLLNWNRICHFCWELALFQRGEEWQFIFWALALCSFKWQSYQPLEKCCLW